MRHRRVLAPINTVKHYVHRANNIVASGSILNDVIVDAVVAPAVAASNQVREGAVVKAVYVESWIQNDGGTGQDNQFNVALEKISSNGPAMTFTQSVNLGGYLNKKNILFTSQGVQGASVDGVPAVPVLRAWVLIPKGKQRFGAGDSLVLNISSTGFSLRNCGLYTYKEYV